MEALDSEQRAAFLRDGFVVVPALLDAATVTACRQRLSALASGSAPVPAGVRAQKEPGVARGEVAAAEASETIRKFEGLVDHDPLFGTVANLPRIVAIMAGLLGPDLKLFRDAVLMKPPHTGSPKGMHQDAPYWPIAPQDEVSCWVPFDATDAGNGCMTAIPGSHRRGPLPHVAVPDDYIVPAEHYRAEEIRSLPMAPGDGLIFHALVLHATGPNRTDRPRRAITLSYMAAASRYTGPPPQPTYRRIAGRDVPGGV